MLFMELNGFREKGPVLPRESPFVRDGFRETFGRWCVVSHRPRVQRERVKSALDSLTEKKRELEDVERQQKEKVSAVREQSHSVQSHITSQFDELRRIITEKEQRALRDLREEEERILNPMEKNLQKIQENLNSIREKMSKLQEQMDQQDNVTFLMENAHRKRRISDDAKFLSVTHGTLPIEKFDHPLLLNTTLREMSDTIKRVSVTLDVEMASPWLEVSEDRKSVRRTGTRRNLPDTGQGTSTTHSSSFISWIGTPDSK
ncbi:E3 ubiquitin-protein ligase TRIM15-like isoform X2 [Hypanus sabinus]|uniref:E3 ubiquitin-protein ligase TRIM15-like isoform X2 n=1 Tax=Hypanus sabinus TaxID=79690 RepID=UPI0028C3FEBE|nr:E3 ubiquitin-protein ligase TRIM15-like isoform X2 [Hypanus sabinus]